MEAERKAAPAELKKYFTIDEVSEVSRISPSVLRIWETRYGWPNPRRKESNGYRVYDDVLVRDLVRAGKLHKSGIGPKEFIVGQAFVDRPLRGEAPKIPQRLNFSALLRYAPDLTHPPSLRTFEEIKRHLLTGNHANAVSLLASWMTVRPFDRYVALWMPAALWVLSVEHASVYATALDAVWKALRASAQHRYDDAVDEAKKLIERTANAPDVPADVPAPRAPEPESAPTATLPAVPPPVEGDGGSDAGAVTDLSESSAEPTLAEGSRIVDRADEPATAAGEASGAPPAGGEGAGVSDLGDRRDDAPAPERDEPVPGPEELHGGIGDVSGGVEHVVAPEQPSAAPRSPDEASPPVSQPRTPSWEVIDMRPYPGAKYVIEGGRLRWL